MLKQLIECSNITLTINQIEGSNGAFGLVLMPKGKQPLSLTFTQEEIPEAEEQISQYLGLSDSIASASNLTTVVASPKDNTTQTTVTTAKATPAAPTKTATTTAQADTTTQAGDDENYDDLFNQLGL